jgi:hypothetical protein
MTDEPNDRKEYFIQAITSFGGGILGMVSDISYKNWLLGSSKMIISSPQIVKMNPTPTGQSVALTLGPVHVLRTPQKLMAINPDLVEIIGHIEKVKNESGEDEYVLHPEHEDDKNSCSLFVDYLRALVNWSAVLADVQMPTPNDIADANRTRQ